MILLCFFPSVQGLYLVQSTMSVAPELTRLERGQLLHRRAEDVHPVSHKDSVIESGDSPLPHFGRREGDPAIPYYDGLPSSGCSLVRDFLPATDSSLVKYRRLMRQQYDREQRLMRELRDTNRGRIELRRAANKYACRRVCLLWGALWLRLIRSRKCSLAFYLRNGVRHYLYVCHVVYFLKVICAKGL